MKSKRKRKAGSRAAAVCSVVIRKKPRAKSADISKRSLRFIRETSEHADKSPMTAKLLRTLLRL